MRAKWPKLRTNGSRRAAHAALLVALLALLHPLPVPVLLRCCHASPDASGGHRSTQGVGLPKAWPDLKIYVYEGPEKWRNWSAWGDIRWGKGGGGERGEQGRVCMRLHAHATPCTPAGMQLPCGRALG
jgi:hypothetical protein